MFACNYCTQSYSTRNQVITHCKNSHLTDGTTKHYRVTERSLHQCLLCAKVLLRESKVLADHMHKVHKFGLAIYEEKFLWRKAQSANNHFALADQKLQVRQENVQNQAHQQANQQAGLLELTQADLQELNGGQQAQPFQVTNKPVDIQDWLLEQMGDAEQGLDLQRVNCQLSEDHNAKGHQCNGVKEPEVKKEQQPQPKQEAQLPYWKQALLQAKQQKQSPPKQRSPSPSQQIKRPEMADRPKPQNIKLREIRPFMQQKQSPPKKIQAPIEHPVASGPLVKDLEDNIGEKRPPKETSSLARDEISKGPGRDHSAGMRVKHYQRKFEKVVDGVYPKFDEEKGIAFHCISNSLQRKDPQQRKWLTDLMEIFASRLPRMPKVLSNDDLSKCG